MDLPRLRYSGKVPRTIPYPKVSPCEALMMTAGRYPDSAACDSFGQTSASRQLIHGMTEEKQS